MTGYMSETTSNLRVLFCFGVLQSLFDVPAGELKPILEAITQAYANLEKRFEIKVLGAFDDDQIMMGPSAQWPWTAYLLADVSSYDVVVQVTNIIRETQIGPYRLSKYMRVESRIGRSLFFIDEKNP